MSGEGVIPADDRSLAAGKPDYETAWRSIFEPLSWMQGHASLNAYLGMGLADIANDLITRAYPELAPAIRAHQNARP